MDTGFNMTDVEEYLKNQIKLETERRFLRYELHHAILLLLSNSKITGDEYSSLYHMINSSDYDNVILAGLVIQEKTK